MREQLHKGPVVLYEQMRLKILELIREQGLKPHDPVPSETELARMFGVSSRTSKEALLQLAREGVVYRMPRRGTFLAASGTASDAEESPDRGTARNLVARNVVGVLMPEMDEYAGQVLQALSERLRALGYEMHVRFSSGGGAGENEAIRELTEESAAAGLIVYPGQRNVLNELLIQLHLSRYPVVIVDRAFREIQLPSVYHDHVRGSFELTAYLVGCGHRRIGFVTEELAGVMSREDRFNGYTQAFLDASLSLDPKLVHKVKGKRSLSEEDRGSLASYLEENRDMTAVVCSNDYVALLVMQTAHRLGIPVPEELSVVGFTDFSFAEWLPVPLTTVEKSASELGAAAAEMLSALIANPERRPEPLVIGTVLKERESVRRLV